MLTWIREKFGTVVISAIIGFLALLFGFYGILTPKATRGLHEGAVAGEVNGEAISISEFNRALNQRIEFYRQMFGGQLSEEQMKAFRLREGVFQELARKKLMVQEAYRLGLMASDEEVRDRIRDIPAFQKDGKFDLFTYKSVLEANSYSPGDFERMMREDLAAQHWEDYFRNRVHVSDLELKKEFLVSNEKRDVKYVLLTTETGKKGVKIDPAEVTKFLADKTKLNLVQSAYDRKKTTDFKGKSFDDVKYDIAQGMLAGEKIDEVRKINDGLANQVLPLLTAEKSGDAKINALLKSYGVEVKNTGPFARSAEYLPGLGHASALMADAFDKKSPIDPAEGGKAKKYSVDTWVAVAILTGNEHPDLAKFDSDREKLSRQVASRKQHELFDEWVKKLSAKAKIETNPAVIGGEPDNG